ncbi:MAG: hypothetical protein IPK16_19230 [Anaerolineales bacterium]|nr:hypothetical protein [Anaerolineales bacterium]
MKLRNYHLRSLVGIFLLAVVFCLLGVAFAPVAAHAAGTIGTDIGDPTDPAPATLGGGDDPVYAMRPANDCTEAVAEGALCLELAAPFPNMESILFPGSGLTYYASATGWLNGYTGPMYVTDGSFSTILTLPPGTGAFYLYFRPHADPFATFTVNIYDKDDVLLDTLTTTLSRDVAFPITMWSLTGSAEIRKVEITTAPGVSVAIGQVGIATELPEVAINNFTWEYFNPPPADAGETWLGGQGYPVAGGEILYSYEICNNALDPYNTNSYAEDIQVVSQIVPPVVSDQYSNTLPLMWYIADTLELSGTVGSCSDDWTDGYQITCAIGDLAANECRSFQVKTYISPLALVNSGPVGAVKQVQAYAISSNFVEGPNQEEAQHIIQAQADLQLTKTLVPGSERRPRSVPLQHCGRQPWSQARFCGRA